MRASGSPLRNRRRGAVSTLNACCSGLRSRGARAIPLRVNESLISSKNPFPPRVHHQLDLLIERDVGSLLGQRQRTVQPSEIVDQADPPSLSARPDTTLRDLVNPLGRGLARLGDLLDELVVEGQHLLFDLGALLVRKRANG